MEFAWVCFNGDSPPRVETIHRLYLNPHDTGADVIFEKNKPCGRWDYIDEHKLFIIEFKASWKSHIPHRRHAFFLRSDGSYQLYMQDQPIYESQELWTVGSVVHHNQNPVVLQRLMPPVTNVIGNDDRASPCNF